MEQARKLGLGSSPLRKLFNSGTATAPPPTASLEFEKRETLPVGEGRGGRSPL